MKLDPQFKEFLSNIRPTTAQQDAWRAAAKTLRSRLASDERLKDVVVSTFLQGSIRRSTAIRPLGEKRPDVDIVVVTDIDYRVTLPKDALSLFVPFLEKFYAGKWRPQGRSFGIELSSVDMDLVITALPRVENPRLSDLYGFSDPTIRQDFKELYRSESVETLETLEEDTTWRLNAKWRQRSVFDELGRKSEFGNPSTAQVLEDEMPSDWRENPLWLPDRDENTWGRTHPLLQISWTATKNRRTNNNYLNIVRAVKWWRLEMEARLPRYPKGYPLEHMVGHLLDDSNEISFAQGLVQVFEAYRDRWLLRARQRDVPILPDHGVREHNVLARLSEDDFAAFVEVIANAAALARAALDEEDVLKSGELWRSLLGSRFPLPPPNGGDRVPAQFSVPSAATTPPKTERFA